MTRECHVRFCERLRGKCLRPTHHFGMKLHIGVDSQSGLAHSAVVTAANVHDKHPMPDLLHGNERRVYRRQCLREPEGSDSVQGAQRTGLHQSAHAQGGVRGR